MSAFQRRSVLFALLTVAMIMLLPGSLASAQGQSLSYGGALIYSISEGSPFGFFNFQGEENDVVTIQVLGVTSGLVPTISLNGPTQQQLAFSTPDPLTPGVARISARLEASGIYTIIVGSSGAFGQFSMRLDGIPATVTEAVSEEPVELSNSPLIVPITADPETAQQLVVSATPEDYAFIAVLRNDDGQVIFTANGSGEAPTQMTILAGSEEYTLEVYAVDPTTPGLVSISLTPLGNAPEAEEEAAGEPAPEETTTATPEVAAEACQVTSNGSNINVRSGPGTNYNVVATIGAGDAYTLLGINGDWYAIELAGGGIGWVFIDVVQVTGNCDDLPVYEFTGESAPPPQATVEEDNGAAVATATFTPSYTPTLAAEQPQQATPTYTPSPTSPPQDNNQQQPTHTATATFTPSYTPTTEPAAQIAPPDANYSLVIPLDQTISLVDFVSYPQGDAQDRISYRVTGMNPNSVLSGGRARMVIAVSCFGTNLDQVEFFANGNTYACGQTIIDREVTFNSNTGSITVTAIGGEGTYVQWVLTGTVTRIN